MRPPVLVSTLEIVMYFETETCDNYIVFSVSHEANKIVASVSWFVIILSPVDV